MKTAEILGMKIGQFAQKHHLLGTTGSTELAKAGWGSVCRRLG